MSISTPDSGGRGGWTTSRAAQTDISYRTNPDLFTQDMLTAKDTFNDQHLIANYVGGLVSADEPPSCVLLWFPEAAGNANAAQWVSAEVWKP